MTDAPGQKDLLRVQAASFSEDRTYIEEGVFVIVEEPLEVRVNGTPYSVLMRTPGSEIELAVGFCLTEGIVDSFEEIESVGFCPDAAIGAENVVNVLAKPVAGRGGGPIDLPPRSRVANTSCGVCGVRTIDDLETRLTRLPPGCAVHADTIIELQYIMSDRQTLSRLTTGTHAAALSGTDGRLHVVMEDVGRHNALDKVIGYAMLHAIDLASCVALLSGRISFEMVQKAVRAGIPVVAAISAATSLAVNLARRFDCTLVGRLRGRSMTVYTCPERITPLRG
jgi:FdhD protein